MSFNVSIGSILIDIIVHGRINGCHRQGSELRPIEYTCVWLHCDYLNPTMDNYIKILITNRNVETHSLYITHFVGYINRILHACRRKTTCNCSGKYYFPMNVKASC